MKKKIDSIIERNKKVEADKAWEISKTRRAIIALLTYMVVVVFLYSINAPNPWINALVPTMGFIISTLVLKPIKPWWVKRFYNHR